MKKTKKGYGKKALSVSLSMALMLGGMDSCDEGRITVDGAEVAAFYKMSITGWIFPTSSIVIERI